MTQVDGKSRLLDVDHVILCAGQDPLRELHDQLTAAIDDREDALKGVTTTLSGAPVLHRNLILHLIGGARKAGELDAKVGGAIKFPLQFCT